MAARSLKRRPLVEQLIEGLTKDIASGRYEVGGKLPPEPELQSIFGVGRSTVREGVRVLAHAGVLEVKPGDGTYVLEKPVGNSEPLAQRLRRARVREVYEVRRALELQGARLAAERRSEADLREMRACLDRRHEHLDDAEGFLQADLEFHVAIARATGNTVLADLTSEFFESARDAIMQSAALPGIRQEGEDDHERLYEAVAAGDVEAAERAIRAIIDQTAARLSSILDADAAVRTAGRDPEPVGG